MKKLIKAISLKKVISVAVTVLVVVLICAVVVVLASQTTVIISGNISYADLELPEMSVKEIANAPPLEGYAAVSQSDAYVMYVNPETTAVALLRRQDNFVLYSQIPEADIAGANPENNRIKSFMQSNIVLKTVETKTSTESELTSSEDSVAGGEYTIESIADGVRITYIFGSIPKERLAPKAMTKATYDLVMKAAGSEQSSVRRRYNEIDITKMSDKKMINDYKEKYPLSKTEPVYIQTEKLQDFALDALDEIFEGAGYTVDDKIKDEFAILGETAQADMPPLYKIHLDVTLKEDVFSAKVDKAAVKHTEAFYPSEITVMPYFMSGGTADEGYMLLPDGSGSIINLNNGKTSATSYHAKIYGDDPMFLPVLEREKTVQSYLPIYGIKTDKYSIFAHITDSAAEAFVNADISGKDSSLNHVAGGISLRSNQKDVVYHDWAAGAGTIYANRVQPGELSGAFKIDFHLMPTGEGAGGYDKMAELYRTILIKSGELSSEKASKPDVLLEMLGAFETTKSVVGVPVKSTIPMTTFDEAKIVANYYKDAGLKFDIKYIAAVNGGYNQKVADKIAFVSTRGKKKNYETLKENMSETGSLYFDISLSQVYKNTLFDAFTVSGDSAVNINLKKDYIYDADPVSFYTQINKRYIISPKKLVGVTEKLADSLTKQNIDGISLRHLGRVLTSDCSLDSPYFREQTATEYEKALALLKDKNIKTMLSGGNAYALSTASYLSDLPYGSNNYQITDESVPFYQMVVHGYIPYSYAAINTTADTIKSALEAISTGAVPSVMISYQDTSLLKNTDYTHYNFGSFNLSKAQNLDVVKRFKAVTEATSGKTIVGYEWVSEDVTKTVFENGVVLLVNMSDEIFSYEGKTVDSMDFILTKEG